MTDLLTDAAEYLALDIARRNGWGPDRASDLARLTGLTVLRCAELARSRDVTAIAERRLRLAAATKWGAVR